MLGKNKKGGWIAIGVDDAKKTQLFLYLKKCATQIP